MKTDQCNLVNVAQQRFVQSLEPGARRNPDFLAGEFLAPEARERLSGRTRDVLRASPFYHYMLARTRHYDMVFLRALMDGAKHVLILGAGADTRAYRFRDLVAECGAVVTEADLPTPIREKRERVRLLGFEGAARHEPLDIGAGDLETRIAALLAPPAKSAVLIEGVSTHIPATAFEDLLRLLAKGLAPGGSVTFDASSAPTEKGLFRHSVDAEKGRAVAASLGFEQRAFWTPAQLEAHYLGYQAEAPFFREDSILEWARP